ncbi:MAG TPA: acetamidase/formamidase family protein [Pseudolabrys sp.]|nr:acetamidase/formamidase family protein [Pseudolabrys sp.]
MKHTLEATPQTVHWGYLDASLPPALTIASGDRVSVDCVSGLPGMLPAPDSGFTIPDNLTAILASVKKDLGVHIYTGPIGVESARPGDVLEIRILNIEIRQDWGWNFFRSYMGTLQEDFPYFHLTIVPLDCALQEVAMPSGLRVPMRPFFGQMAVAPRAECGRVNSKEPREFGGNLDCKELTAGSTLYLPVQTDGALFSVGDGHAAQGDGEVNGTAIETALRGTFEFHLHKDRRWAAPRAETPTHFITFGLDPSLDTAAKQALRNMIDWVVEMTGIERSEAYSLCSIACDLRVTQTVNNVKGIHAMIEKSILLRRG